VAGVLTTVFFPSRLLIAVWKRLGVGPFSVRLRYDAVVRSHYAYGIYWAALEAKKLGLNGISVIEFGVAGGNGLLVMEQHAAEVERETGVAIQVYGFDRASGLPPPSDYRDMPYAYRAGTYSMDRASLEERLERAKLVIGDVAQTARSFVADYHPAPIGFIAFDLDLYSSTNDSFALFSAPDDFLLPRVFCYFDDVVGSDLFLMNEYVGELRSIREFNESNERQKIAPIYGFAQKRVLPCWWAIKMFAFHRFDHRLYTAFVDQEIDTTLKSRPK
jgi:hypothetical protein